MSNYFNLPDEHLCTGCAACMGSCAAGAIKMSLNSEGFYHPYLSDEKNCTSCGLCTGNCPVLNSEYINSSEPDCYALMASDDVRAVSSSGGAFELIADYIFERGGVVFGAAYDEDFRTVHHIAVEDKSEFYKLRGSKYIMSDMSEVYPLIRKYVSEGRYVLFSGVPCEVAGINSFLGKLKDAEHFISVDLICHGIPSVKAFSNYMRDCHGNRKIEHLGFKDKEYGWHASMTVGFNSNEIYNSPCEKDDYFRSYLNGLNKNACCGDCKFAAIPRQGDITIGDYWGINDVNPEYNDKKGTSVVLFNSEKSKQFSEYLKNNSKLFEKTTLEGAVKGNSNLITSPKNLIARNQFFRNLDNRHFPDLVRWAFADRRYDIGIVGIPIFPNFGGALTYYALYRTLRDRGYTVAMFSRPRSTGRSPIAPEKIYTVNPYDAANLLLDYRDKDAMSSAGNICEAFVVGSDQLFNADLYKTFGEIVTLDWISDNHRKVAYAASFGHNYFWGDENQRAKMAHYMQKFDGFSVREMDAVPLTHHTFGVESEWVLDPVFLCDKEHYIRLAEKSEISSEEPHIFAYILDPDKNKDEIVKICSDTLNLPVELYSEMLFEASEERIAEEAKRFAFTLRQGNINDRLKSLISSDFIVADSFHGICFAIIFEKPFIAILNPLRGASRFYSVLGKLNLLDHLVTNTDELNEKISLVSRDTSYKESLKILNSEKERCINWLIGNLYPEDEQKKSFSDVDIINEKFKAARKENIIRDLKINSVLCGYELYNCRNIYSYMDALKKRMRNLLIMISVKDTPGYSFNESMQRKFAALGLKSNLVNKHWQSYIAVIDGGKIVSEKLSIKGERVAYTGKISGKDIKLVSRSFNNGNVAAAFINGTDYSENRRGFNFVIYDKVTAEVVDTVTFDTHDSNVPYTRFRKRMPSVNESYMTYETGIKDDSVVPENIPAENKDIYYCCRFAVSRSNERKIILWGKNEVFADILRNYFDISDIIQIDDRTTDSLKEYSKKSNEFYIVVPNRKFDNIHADFLRTLGFNELADYVYRNIRPVVIKNRNFENEPYYDIFSNSITGNIETESTVIFRGFNNHISFGNGCTFGGGAELHFDCSNNSIIKTGNKVRFVGKNSFTKIDCCSGVINIGNDIIFIDNQVRLISNTGESSVTIKDRVTFNTGTVLHCSSGKKLIIGEDTMFSINVRVLCGDGHSLFDVISGENINSVPDILTTRSNEIVIGNHVWVGINSTILTGSIIGNGSVVGANALVKGVFPNNCAIGGNPAKKIKDNIAWSRKNSSLDVSDCGADNIRLTELLPSVAGKKVLVLGGTRFMGIKLVEKLCHENAIVTIATRGIHADNFGDKVQRIKIDRLNPETIRSKFDNHYYDIVFDNTAYCSNAVDNILSVMNCGRYIQVSSGAVYTSDEVVKTEQMFNPYSGKYELLDKTEDYGLGKRYAESVLCQKYKDINSAVVRIPFVVEPDNLDNKDLNMRLYFYAEHIVKSIPMKIDNYDYECSFVKTSEEADFLIYLGCSDYKGIYNFSSEGSLKVRDIIEYIEKKSGKKAVITEDGDLHPFNTKHFRDDSKNGMTFDLSKVRETGYKPENVTDWIYPLLDMYINMLS